MEYFSHLLLILKNISNWNYLLIFALSFFESTAFIGIIIPGTIAVTVGGFLAAQGIIDIEYLFIFAVLGAILGDNFSYYLGKKGIIAFQEKNKIFKLSLLEKGEIYFKKHGHKSVFLGRFIGWFRPIIPFVAGLFKLNRKTFLFWNVSSSLLWAAFHIALGYFFGQTWQVIILWSNRIAVFIAIFIIAVIIFYLLEWLIAKKGKKILAFLISIWRSITHAIAGNPDVLKITAKHPLFFEFIKKRLDRNKLSGLPTSLLAMAFLYILFLFVGIVEKIITSNAIITTDTNVANLLAVFRSAELSNVFLWITLLGKWQIILGFAGASAGILWLWRQRTYIAPLFLAILGSEIFAWLGKITIHRARPENSVYTENSFSFPSGHATLSIAFYGWLAYMLIRRAKRWPAKVNIFFTAAGIILLVGFSRLYLGVHYVSDVWGGYLVGALWLIISISVSEWLNYKKNSIVFSPSIRTRSAAIVLILASLLFYIGYALNFNPAAAPLLAAPKEIIVQDMDNFLDDQLKYTQTLTGQKQEPLSFIILADNDNELVKSFYDSGWFLADQADMASMAKLAQAAFLQKTYPAAPMTPSFWNSQVHNFGFEKPTQSNNVRERHHARFWKTNYITPDKKQIYVGTASLDIGLKWGVTHKINPDIDTEREFLLNDLIKIGAVADWQKQKFVESKLGQNFSGDLFFTDGQIYIIFMN